MKAPASIEVSLITVLQIYSKIVNEKASGDKKKSYKRVTRNIQALKEIEADERIVQVTEGTNPEDTVFLPMKKKDRIAVWDLFKEDLSNCSIVEETMIKRIAVGLGKLDEFDALVEDTEPENEDDEEENEEETETTEDPPSDE